MHASTASKSSATTQRSIDDQRSQRSETAPSRRPSDSAPQPARRAPGPNEFCFFIEPPLHSEAGHGDAGAAAPRVGDACPIPAGLSYATFVPAPDGEPGAERLDIRADRPRRPVPFLSLEVIHTSRRAELWMVGPRELRPLLNGSPAPLLTHLEIGDQLLFANGTIVHVSQFVAPSVGPAPAECIGKTCPTCSVQVAAGVIVYVCRCGTALHLQGEETPVEDRLRCADTDVCPCTAKILRKAGYLFVPEL